MLKVKRNEFAAQNRLAYDLLEHPRLVALLKTTRAGATISLLLVAVQLGMKVVVLVPTKRIIRSVIEIIGRICGRPLEIGLMLSNAELCAKLEPSTEVKFQFKQDCSKCDLGGKANACGFQNLLLKDHQVVFLTYDKLNVLTKSKSKDSERLLNKLRSCQVYILDEDSTAVRSELPTLKIAFLDNDRKRVRISRQLRDFLAADSPFLDDDLSEEKLYRRRFSRKNQNCP